MGIYLVNGGYQKMISMRKSMSVCSLFFIILLLLTTRQAQSGDITLFNTGFDDNGNLLSSGSIDTHYTLITSADPNFSGPNTYVVNNSWPIAPAGPWMANNSVSQWISHRPDAANITNGGHYIFRTTFDLTGYNTDTALLTGRWASDNTGLDILINGISTGNSNPGQFTSFSSFSIADSFIDGLNTLDFIVHNIPFPPNSPSLGGSNPSGLRVELGGIAEPSPVPEPTTMMLTGSGIVALIFIRRKLEKA